MITAKEKLVLNSSVAGRLFDAGVERRKVIQDVLF